MATQWQPVSNHMSHLDVIVTINILYHFSPDLLMKYPCATNHLRLQAKQQVIHMHTSSWRSSKTLMACLMFGRTWQTTRKNLSCTTQGLSQRVTLARSAESRAGKIDRRLSVLRRSLEWSVWAICIGRKVPHAPRPRFRSSKSGLV